MSISAIGNALGNHQTGALSYQIQNSQFQQLGKDLTSGNLSAARSDFATLQQAFAQAPAVSSSTPQDLISRTGLRHLPYQHHIAGGGDPRVLKQDLNQLGQDLSASTFLSGNLSAAQQAYGSPAQMFGTVTQTTGLGTGRQASSTAPASGGAVSLMA